eukprot:CAMPEP_0204577608 /NCGR_PEP_ID=MMETSP0661-20131031/42444_1 /ASSEMBLY_ACC=CAM_ASM_000606 /TAXON_ID=109239 /ORGANISM="Alexandrium margalefi, Strain AMGDE01CS-322" /LENGTH=37 /DNA_ID= /DNA_START= /DNA_END= /DNA_ORIENTATION=
MQAHKRTTPSEPVCARGQKMPPAAPPAALRPLQTARS